MGEKLLADTLEEDNPDLKPIREMISFWQPEGGEFLSCPKCKCVMIVRTYIQNKSI